MEKPTQSTEPSVITGQFADVVQGRIYPAEIWMKEGKVVAIQELATAPHQLIMPGLVDAHIHIESSMMTPASFARIAVQHGTVATVSDPHEIANVCGIEGVNYMIDSGKKVPFYFNFGAPSCVPATAFESAGAVIDSFQVDQLLAREEILYLSEMMNYPAVVCNDAEVMAKIGSAIKHNKPIDGHAPGLRGENLEKYVASGISTDHECVSLDEALEKISLGMKILIREGSAAKNYDALAELLNMYPEQVMFCSDDKHPNELVNAHIDELVRRSISHRFNVMNVLRAATLNPVNHYKLKNGLMQVGDFANYIIAEHIEEFRINKTFINGQCVYENNQSLIEVIDEQPINKFNCKPITVEDIQVQAQGRRIKVIEVLDGQLITRELIADATIQNGYVVSDIEKDILKLVVVNRYNPAKPAVAFVRNMDLKKGAIASSIAHDSHNIIAVGVDDGYIVEAINNLIQVQGGISTNSSTERKVMPLAVAGLMQSGDGHKIAREYEEMHDAALSNGSKLTAPFMTLSFLALLVIPQLKLSDKGLFDGNKFDFTDLFVD
ncbi:MAG: adenine deaminase [Bacteroidota bacterium]|nr:adenine deaminase [Bacteroidota bacterium]